MEVMRMKRAGVPASVPDEKLVKIPLLSDGVGRERSSDEFLADAHLAKMMDGTTKLRAIHKGSRQNVQDFPYVLGTDP